MYHLLLYFTYSQYLACIIYFVKIRERGMLPKQTFRNPLKLSREEINVKFEIVKEIFLANTYMLSRQLSLMLLWASATARATLLGMQFFLFYFPFNMYFFIKLIPIE